MKKTDILNKVTRTFHKATFQVKKHSPEILIAAGVVGVVTSGVLACKATLKVNAVTEETKHNIEKIHEATEKGVTEAGETYTVEDSKKDLAVVYTQTAVKLVKLYAPSVALGALSIAGIVTSHKIMTKRNVALAAAYTAVDKGFKEYRGRVVERFGEALDKELKYGVKAVEIEEKVVNEDGTEGTVKKVVDVINGDPMDVSPYARFFDDGCAGWDEKPEFSLMFLINQQRYANKKLKEQGFLFLNDVYEMLGIHKCAIGQQVGWIYDENCPNGDNYIDFGIHDLYKEKNRDFVNGYEKVILLDFNCDGYILDKI